eukprot:2559759-Pyramimonas_sp.AAC.1
MNTPPRPRGRRPDRCGSTALREHARSRALRGPPPLPGVLGGPMCSSRHALHACVSWPGTPPPRRR